MIFKWPSSLNAYVFGRPGQRDLRNATVDPSPGCYTSLIRPLFVGNRTDTTVFIYEDERCQGRVIGRVAPRTSGVFEFARGVRVPRGTSAGVGAPLSSAWVREPR